MRAAQATLVRLVQALVLLAWALAYLWLLADDRYLLFLAPHLRPLLVAALLLLAVFFLGTFARRGGAAVAPRGAALGLRAAVLLLPLLYLAAMPAQGLGSRAAVQRGLVASLLGADRSPAPASDRPPGGPLTLLELHLDLERQLGHRVNVDGMVYRGPEIAAGHFALVRFVITCCAADAQPLGVLVASPQADTLRLDAWVRVAGELTLIDHHGEPTACIRDATVTPLDPPASPYLFRF